MAAQDLPLQNGRGRFFAQFRRDYGEEDLSGYFNSGVLVMNLKRLRETKRFERFAELARKSYQFPDQDILNRCCKGEVAYLPAVWNMFPGTLLQKESLPGQGCTEQDRDDIRAGRAALLHFAGEAKPWKSVRTLYDMEWLLYAERLPRTKQTAPFLENARNQVEEEELPDRMEELREARYILFGFTFMSRELADDLLARKFRKPLCFCDSNPDKQGKSYRGIPCLSVEEARKLLDTESFVVICSQQRWREVLDRLHRLDIPDAQILRLHFDNLSITAAEKPYGIGLLMGVFDLFHIGHLNLIRRAKAQCRFLRVGVLADELVYSFKKIHPTIPQEERMEILRALRDVDEVVLLEEQEDVSRLNEWKKRPFDCFFSGDDYVGNPYWDWEREELRKLGADLVFFPYTKQRSSSMIRRELKERGASESK
jgi:glycerol-3-phosphate cytidylyltransferase